MSILSKMIALEELDQELNAEISTDTPEIQEVEEQAQEFNEVAEGIDNDTNALVESADALESIIELVSASPGDMNKPIDAFASRAVRIAMEANEILASSSNRALSLTDDKGTASGAAGSATKGDFIAKAKEFAKKIWETLAGLARRIIDWIKKTWANATDRLVKNVSLAKKLADKASKVKDKSGAKINDDRVMSALANAEGKPVATVLKAVFDHARIQSEKASLETVRQAGLLVEAVASGKSNSESLVDAFVKHLADTAGLWEAEATPAQAQETKSPAGTDVYVSAPFFGGYRAWLTVPQNSEKLQAWNHGLTKIEEAKPAPKDALSTSDVVSLCEYIVTGQDLIALYRNAVKPLDELSVKLKKAVAAEKGEGDKKLVQQMQAIIPRIIKGPQVASYNYAATASSYALAYAKASLAAHASKGEGEKTSTDLVVV